jgi:hypothetical protein
MLWRLVDAGVRRGAGTTSASEMKAPQGAPLARGTERSVAGAASQRGHHGASEKKTSAGLKACRAVTMSVSGFGKFRRARRDKFPDPRLRTRAAATATAGSAAASRRRSTTTGGQSNCQVVMEGPPCRQDHGATINCDRHSAPGRRPGEPVRHTHGEPIVARDPSLTGRGGLIAPAALPYLMSVSIQTSAGTSRIHNCHHDTRRSHQDRLDNGRQRLDARVDLVLVEVGDLAEHAVSSPVS